MDSERPGPPPGVLERLRQLVGYTWDDFEESFHSSYDIWYVWASDRMLDTHGRQARFRRQTYRHEHEPTPSSSHLVEMCTTLVRYEQRRQNLSR